MANTKKVATKKVATKKVAAPKVATKKVAAPKAAAPKTIAPVKGGKKNKLTLAAVILGYIGVVFAIFGVYCLVTVCQDAFVNKDESNLTGLVGIVVLILVALTNGIVSIVKAVKVEKALNKKHFLVNVILGALMLAMVIVKTIPIAADFDVSNPTLWLVAAIASSVLFGLVLGNTIVNTIWMKKAVKVAK